MGIRAVFSIHCAVFVALVAAAALSAEARAQELFMDDFEEMGAHRWHVGGDGHVNVENFGGSMALKMTKRGYAIAAVRIDGQLTLNISVSLMADSLEAGDACVAEASADGGAIWMDVLRLEDGDDTLSDWQTGEEQLTLPGAMSTLAIRLRAEGNANSDICWADDVWVSVAETPEP